MSECREVRYSYAYTFISDFGFGHRNEFPKNVIPPHLMEMYDTAPMHVGVELTTRKIWFHGSSLIIDS